jgi:hypothetical protein
VTPPLICTLPQVLNVTGTACVLPVPNPITTSNEIRYSTLLSLSSMRFWGYCGSSGKFWGQNHWLVWSQILEAQASVHIQQVAVTVPPPPPAENEILRQGSWTIGELLSTRLTDVDCAKVMNPGYTAIGVSSFGPPGNPFWSIMLGTTDSSTTLIIGPVTAYSITSTEAIVSWSVTEPATGQTEYGTTTENGLFSTPENSYIYKTHIQRLSGLSPGTLYYYRVHSTDANGSSAVSAYYTFTTLTL